MSWPLQVSFCGVSRQNQAERHREQGLSPHLLNPSFSSVGVFSSSRGSSMFEDGKTEPPWGLLSLSFPQFPEMLLQFGGQFCKPGGDDWTLVSV